MASCKTFTKDPETYKSDTYKTYEEELMKSLEVDMDDHYLAHAIDNHLEEHLEIMQK